MIIIWLSLSLSLQGYISPSFLLVGRSSAKKAFRQIVGRCRFDDVLLVLVAKRPIQTPSSSISRKKEREKEVSQVSLSLSLSPFFPFANETRVFFSPSLVCYTGLARHLWIKQWMTWNMYKFHNHSLFLLDGYLVFVVKLLCWWYFFVFHPPTWWCGVWLAISVLQLSC